MVALGPERPHSRTKVQALIDQSRGNRTDAEERQVADASLLALGALSHRMETRQPELRQLAHEALDTRLRTARGTEGPSVALVGRSHCR